MLTETRKIELMQEVAQMVVLMTYNIKQHSFCKWSSRIDSPFWNKEEENWISENLEIELGEVKRKDINK